MINADDRIDEISDSRQEFECKKYFTCENADLSLINKEYYYQYYKMLKDNTEYLYSFSTLEKFDTAWDNVGTYQLEKN